MAYQLIHSAHNLIRLIRSDIIFFEKRKLYLSILVFIDTLSMV